MTNGTSQGLYVIVAVVIFGIFVAISYLLFQDVLSPKLTYIFEESLDEVDVGENLLMFSKSSLYTEDNGDEKKFIKRVGNSWVISSKGTKDQFRGIRFFNIENVELNKKYLFSYTATISEGSLENIGGHLITANEFYINGLKISDTYGLDTLRSFPDRLSRKMRVSVYLMFKTQAELNNFYREGFLIQPNRYLKSGDFTVNISKLAFQEVI